MGMLKLRAIELLSQLISLRKTQINEKLHESKVCKTLMKLVHEHPWNNFIQLKIHQVFEDFLESENTAEQKLAFIRDSEVVELLLLMSEMARVTFDSGNSIRNGYMGFVINLATKLKKVIQAEKLEALDGASAVLTQAW